MSDEPTKLTAAMSGMIEDRVDHFLVAVDHLQQPFGRAGFAEQFGQAHRHRGVAFRRLQDKGVAGGDRHAEHPHRDHRREVERGDPGADAERLAHRIDVDARTGALGVFALEHLRDAAGVFDHLEPALDVASGVVDHFAVLARQQFGELLHVILDQLLVAKHHPRALLRVGRGPAGLDRFRRGDGAVEFGLAAERDLRLHGAAVRVEHVSHASVRSAAGASGYQVIDLAHGEILSGETSSTDSCNLGRRLARAARQPAA